jgi:hypothetical protein
LRVGRDLSGAFAFTRRDFLAGAAWLGAASAIVVAIGTLLLAGAELCTRALDICQVLNDCKA